MIEIDVNDDAFKAFQASFTKYQEALRSMPGAWGKVNTAVDAQKEGFLAIAAAMLAQAEHIRHAERESQKMARTTDHTARSMSGLARSTRDVARHIGEATRSLLRWTGITTAIGGLLGVGGGLFGIERLAQSAARTRTTGMGYGLSRTGLMQGLGIQFGQFMNVPGALGQTASAQQDPRLAWIFSGMGVPGARTQSPDRALIEEMRAARRLYLQTPQQIRQPTLESRGFLNIFSMEEIRRLAGMSNREFEQHVQRSQGFAGRGGLDTNTLKAWQDFNIRLHDAGTAIENNFIRALTPLAPQIDRLVRTFGQAVETFLKSDVFKHWIDAATDGIKMFANWIGSPQMKKDGAEFVKELGELTAGVAAAAKKIVSAMKFLGLIPDEHGHTGAAGSFIANHPIASAVGGAAAYQAGKAIIGAGARAAVGAAGAGAAAAGRGVLGGILGGGIAAPLAGLWTFLHPSQGGSPEEVEREKKLRDAAVDAARKHNEAAGRARGSAAPPSPPATPPAAAVPAAPHPSSIQPPQGEGGFIKRQEGLVLHRYNDVGHPAIGYGHDFTPEEMRRGYAETDQGRVSTSGTITRGQADALFRRDYMSRMQQVAARVPGFDRLNANQREAVLSYYYNTGRLPRGLAANLGRGDYGAIASSIEHGISTVHGAPFAPLVRRRREEARLFGRPVQPTPAATTQPAAGDQQAQASPAHAPVVHVHVNNNTGGSAVVSTSQLPA